MAYNVRNENYSNYSNHQLDNRSRQEHLRTQRHINTGHAIREQACNGVQRYGICAKSMASSFAAVLFLYMVVGASFQFGAKIIAPCAEMRYLQWANDKPISWSDDKISFWNTRCRGALPSTPRKGGLYMIYTVFGLSYLVHRGYEKELLREAGFQD